MSIHSHLPPLAALIHPDDRHDIEALLERVARRLQQSGHHVGGLVHHQSLYANGNKCMRLLDLSSGQQFEMTEDLGVRSKSCSLNPQALAQDPLWRSVSAVRSGRVHCAPVLPFGWLDGPPSVNSLIGVRWLLEKLHPAALARQASKSLDQAVREFYALFYGAQLSQAQLRALLDATR